MTKKGKTWCVSAQASEKPFANRSSINKLEPTAGVALPIYYPHSLIDTVLD